ncbi:MAG: glucodextranase DOMON-like domain-containing protein, partial [bacterium]
SYVPTVDFPEPPTLENVQVTAADKQFQAGTAFVLTADVTDAGDGIGDVLADLRAIAGSPLARLYDDGVASHGDVNAGDGTYSLLTTVPLGSPGGELELRVNAYDASNRLASTVAVSMEVVAEVEIIIHAEDPAGDDHGPNRSGTERFYTIYPTNSAFVPGAFDLLSLDVYETTHVVGGALVEMIAFEIHIGDFPDPADDGTADWAPYYAEMNIEKIDIVIDSDPGGATASLPNRQAAFQRWDAWDYAIIMDGWYKALVPSLGQNTLESWRENALTTDNDIILLGDPVLDRLTALVSKEGLGNPTADDIRGWDLCVMMSSHDFGGEEVLGGIRWVNTSGGEWNFGGGHDTDKDANLIDLLLVPGIGKNPGATQEEMLDYESPQAIDRLDRGLTPVALEITAFEDTGPPIIRLDDVVGETLIRSPLIDAPIAMTLEIADDWRVDTARFRYRATNYTGKEWAVEADMGYLGNDLWSIDILPSWLDSNLVYSPVDSSRFLEFQVFASDPLEKTTISPITTVQINPYAACRDTAISLASGDLLLRQVDGSQVVIGDILRQDLVTLYKEEAWTGDELAADSLGNFIDLGLDVCIVPADIMAAPTVPAGEPLGVFRDVFLDAYGTDGSSFAFDSKLPRKYDLTLHYPQAWLKPGFDENKIALYEYHPRSDRWVMMGGHVNPAGNNVTISLNHTGTFGLFQTQELTYNADEVVSGVLITPNPFSPNGDDLYDETTISFFLNQEATVTVEIYNIEGKRQRRITETFPFSGEDNEARIPRRISGLVWDGRDQAGDQLPYGIYILRLIVTYNQAGGQRSIRSNHSVAVIR